MLEEPSNLLSAKELQTPFGRQPEKSRLRGFSKQLGFPELPLANNHVPTGGGYARVCHVNHRLPPSREAALLTALTMLAYPVQRQ